VCAMWDENERYFDYVEIRRRIERRLASGRGLVVHCLLFMLALAGSIAMFAMYEGTSRVAWLNLFMAGWSGILLLHGIGVYRYGGSSTTRRLAAVQAEINERIEAADTELLATPREAFRVQSLLDEDVRLRAGWVPALDFALLINCFIWGMTLAVNATSGDVWFIVLMLSMFWLPATYAVNQTRRLIRDSKLRQVFSQRAVSFDGAIRRKRSFDSDLERYVRLSDDGELIDLPDDWALSDGKLKRG